MTPTDLAPRGSPTREGALDAGLAAGSPGPRPVALAELHRPTSRHGRSRGRLVRRALVTADLLGIFAAFLAAQLSFDWFGGTTGRFSPLTELLLFAASLPGWLFLARAYGLYSRDEERTDHSTVDDVFAIVNMITLGAFLLYAAIYAFPGLARIPLPKILLFWLLAILLVPLARAVARSLCRRTRAYVQNTVIVGAGHVGQRVAQKLLQHPEYGVNVVGFVDEHPRERQEGLGDLTVIGTVPQLPALVERHGIERVIVAFTQHPHIETLGLVRDLNRLDVQVDIVPRLFEVLGPHATIHAAEGLPLLGLPPARLTPSAMLAKRIVDIVLSAVGLIAVGPILAAVAIACRLDSSGPVIFRQTRIGYGNREFTMLKFRTMVADADAHKGELAHLNRHGGGDDRMFKITNDPRVTRVGRFLRRYSLDELPQLWNVLRGEMSLVGPRPLIPEEHHFVNGWAQRRVDLKPGMTGLWQVLGRDDIPFGEMVGLDYRYVSSWSLGTDIKLLLKTVAAMRRTGG